MDKRLIEIESWLKQDLQLHFNDIELTSGDASFRRYFRVSCDDISYIIMDASPEMEPNISALSNFIRFTQALRTQGVNVPIIHHQSQNQGLLLLEDLGDITYLEQLTKGDHLSLYTDAINSLLLIQKGITQQASFVLPIYDETLLSNEMDLFEQWYVKRHLSQTIDSQQQSILKSTKNILISACLAQPQVWVHRDYHSRNLMINKKQKMAVIDFQDMVLGPISYDLASIFKDCYIQWPREQQIKWLEEYYQLAHTQLSKTLVNFSFDELLRWYDLTGLQRHLKVLGIFCRLNYRDNKSQYLDDLPLVKSYVYEVCEFYPELSDFAELFKQLNQNDSV